MKMGLEALNAYVSYADEDKPFLTTFQKHRNAVSELRFWDRSLLLPGDEHEKVINNELHEACFFIIFVSKAYLSMPSNVAHELNCALSRYDDGDEIRLIPIILSACMWELTPYGKFHSLPKKEGSCITDYSNHDKAWTEILIALGELVLQYRQRQEENRSINPNFNICEENLSTLIYSCFPLLPKSKQNQISNARK